MSRCRYVVTLVACAVGALWMIGALPRANAQQPVVENGALPVRAPWEVVQEPLSPLVQPVGNDSILTSFAVGARTWLSWGQSDRNHAADFVDPISDLRWRNTSSEALEISASALLLEKLVVSAGVGAGGISGGRFRDQDFLISGRQAIVSDTISPITNDDLLYFNADLGWRFYEDGYCAIDGLIGYQFWSEKYVAEGGARLPSLDPGPPLPPGPGITERFTWQGFRVGAQGFVQISPRCAVKSSVMFMPITHLKVEDIHHNRRDFRQDPSGIDRATGGFGVLAEVRVRYWLWRGLFLEAGYRIWDTTSGNGETLIRARRGDIRVPFDEGNTTRQGLILGLSYHF